MKIINLLLVLLLLPIANALTIGDVIQNPSKIAPGEKATISIDIKNEEDKDLKNVDVKLDLSDVNLPIAPISSSAEKTIDELDQDERKTLNFDIITLSTAESKIYKIPLKISYQDKDNVVYQKSDVVSLIIEAKPNIDVTSTNNYIIKGQEQTLIIKVVNNGLAPIKFLDMQLLPSSYYTILSSNKIYIGNIDSDDSDTAEYKLLVNNDAPKNLQLLILVNYRDTSNKLYSDTKVISVNAYDNNEAEQLGLVKTSNLSLIIGVIIALIIIFIIYRMIKRRRKK
jgi:hypothetical protein